MPFDRWMAKQMVVLPYNEIYSIIKRKELLGYENASVELKSYSWVKKRQSIMATYCAIPITWYSGKENL